MIASFVFKDGRQEYREITAEQAHSSEYVVAVYNPPDKVLWEGGADPIEPGEIRLRRVSKHGATVPVFKEE